MKRFDELKEKGLSIFKKKKETLEAIKEIVEEKVVETKEKVELIVEDNAAKTAQIKKQEEENKALFEDPIPAIMSPRFHFYRGFVFAILLEVVALLFFVVGVS
jgi:hypothetical protein